MSIEKSKPTVSVIIPTYHGDKYLERAICSVLNQVYKNIELIVVDDNGVNTEYHKKTKKIIEKYQNKILYIVHYLNKKGAAARNSGLKACRGEFICFLDDDDLMLPERISKCVELLMQNPEYDAVFTDVLCTDEKLNPMKIVKVRKNGDCHEEILLQNMFFGTGSNIFITRKAFIETGYFDEKFIRHQDLEYMLRFYRNFQSVSVPEILLIKSKNGSNNIPNYEKLKKTKEMYFNKFQIEINKLSEKDKKIFYKRHNDELKSVTDDNTFIEKLHNNGMKNIRDTIKYCIYVMFPKTSLFPLVNRVRKYIKGRKLKKEMDDELIEFIKTFR